MNKNEKPCIDSGTRVNTPISRVQMYHYSEEIQCPSLVDTIYVQVEKLPQARQNRLYRIIEEYLGYQVPDGITEAFKIDNQWTFKWLWDCHEPVKLSDRRLREIGAIVDQQAERMWEVA